MKEFEKNGKISKVMDATLEDLEGNMIHCTLWDDHAVKMQQFPDNQDPSLAVIVILQLCKLKKYLGKGNLNNFNFIFMIYFRWICFSCSIRFHGSFMLKLHKKLINLKVHVCIIYLAAFTLSIWNMILIVSCNGHVLPRSFVL
ncbi:unnamed protein product [Trifolium pratense]|uniref:Uncharacterized protein n=1 Tax=Trifolium pratense TaxID=57577 RepID=A0ACB0MCA3_TRIPR|nr:unnamed protein product [Trifolium pratense]